MTERDRLDSPLPPDLAEVERLLREPAAAPPPELLERIHASRDLGVVVERMLLAEEEFAARTRRKRTLFGIAAAAMLTVGAFASWQLLAPNATTAGPTAALVAATPGVAAPPPSAASEVSRLLQPWPSVAHAQAPARGEEVRAPGAPLEPGAQARLIPATRRYTQLRRGASGQVVSRARVEVQLDSSHYRGALRWLLTTRIEESPGTMQMDSIILEPKSLRPLQRRVHAGGSDSYFRYTPTQVLGTDTLPRVFFQEEFDVRRSLWDANRPSGRGYWFSMRDLDPRSRLVLSEAHLALLLRTLPLSVGLQLPVVFFGNAPKVLDGVQPLQVRVTQVDTLAHESVATPCFRVELDYGARPDLWWVRVSDGELIRASRTTPGTAVNEVTWLTAVSRLRH